MKNAALRSVDVIPEAAEDHICGMNGCDPTCVYGKISVLPTLTVD